MRESALPTDLSRYPAIGAIKPAGNLQPEEPTFGASLPGLQPDQFNRQAQPTGINPALLAAMTQPNPALQPGQTDPRTAALALMLARQNASPPQGTGASAPPSAGLPPLPRAAATGLQAGQPRNNPDATPVDPAAEANKKLALIAKGLAGVTGLSFGSYALLNLLDGSNWLTGETTPTRQANSALAKVTHFLDTAPGVGNLSHAIDNRLASKATGNQSLQQLLYRLSPEELERKVMSTEYDKFYKALAEKGYNPALRESVRNRQLKEILTEPLHNLPDWAKQKVLRQQIMEAPASLSEEALRNVYDKIISQVGQTERPPVWAETDELLTKAIKGKDPAVFRWMQEKLHVGANPQAPQLWEQIGTDPKLQSWLTGKLEGDFAKAPNGVRQMVLEEFERATRSELGDVGKYLGIQKELNSLKGGLFGWTHNLPFNNTVRNGVGKLFKRPDEPQVVQQLAARAYDALKDKIDDPALLRELKVTAEKLDGKMTTRRELLGALGNIETATRDQVKQARVISDHLEGFTLRTRRLLNMGVERYREDKATINALSNPDLVREFKVTQLLKNADLPAPTVQNVVAAMKESPEALTQAVQSAGLGDDVAAALKTIQEQTAKGVGPLKGLGRSWVGFHNTLKRIFSGEVMNDFLPQQAHAVGEKIADGALGRFRQVAGSMAKVGLTGGFIFAPAIFDTMAADNKPGEKIKSFFRGFLGSGLGWTLFWALLQHINLAADLDGKVLGSGSQKLFSNLPLLGKSTRGGAFIEFLGAMVFGAIGDSIFRRVSDLLFGKPMHIQREEAKKKLEKAQKELQRQQRDQLSQQMARLAQGASPLGAGLPGASSIPPVNGPSPLLVPGASAISPSIRGAQGLQAPSGTASRAPQISALSPDEIANRGSHPLRGLNE